MIVVALAIAALSSSAFAVEIPSSGLELVIELVQRSRNVRFVLRNTSEGNQLAERLIGHPIQREQDFQLLAAELQRGSRSEIVEQLAERLPRFERGSGDAWLKMAAREGLELKVGLSSNQLADNVALEFLDTPGFSAYTAVKARFAMPASGLDGHLSRLKVAAVQYPVEGGRSLEELLAKMEYYLVEAKANGAQLVVLPELFVWDLVSARSGVSEMRQLAEIAKSATPKIFERAAQLSRELDIAVLAGSSPREAGGGIVNTAQLSFPSGKTLLQDKLYLTPDEAAWNWKPGQELKVFDTPWGRSTILICYDSQFPSLSAQLGRLAPEVILVPSMTGAKGFNRVTWASQARAVEHHAYVVVTGTVDSPRASMDFAAQASIFTPQDSGFSGVIAKGPRNREAILYGELDLEKLRASRKAAGLYSTRDEGLRKRPVAVKLDPILF